MSYSSSTSSTSDDELTQIEDEFVANTFQYMLQYVQNQNNPTQNRRRRIERNREIGHKRLYNDYFSENPVYNSDMFRRLFRMHQHVFLPLVQVVESYDSFFQQAPDCTGRMGLSTLQKCTAALRVLAYGESYDRVDEYLRIGETTARSCVEKFADAVISEFGPTYLRSPTVSDLEKLLRVGEEHGFPGMLGSIDCMHWQWKNCPSG